MKRLAYVVSSHGFGHAARACATIEALWTLEPAVQITILGRTPDWFFHQSLGLPGEHGEYELVSIDTDIGLVQTTALRENAGSTAELLVDRLPFDTTCGKLADAVASSGAEAVVCDISPWGLAAAHNLGLPSLLVENFTWDWIYAGYPDLQKFEEPFQRAFGLATRHVQTEPVCRPVEHAACVTPPVSRRSRTRREVTRKDLNVGHDDRLVMMTMGGVAWSYEHLEFLGCVDTTVWLLAGGARGVEMERLGRHILLPHRSPLYHPDLVAAADVVVGKLGYSTVAEVAAAGTRFLYVPRPQFPESDLLEAWTLRHLTAQRVDPERLEAETWLSHVASSVDEILRRPRPAPLPNGASQVAAQVLSLC